MAVLLVQKLDNLNQW